MTYGSESIALIHKGTHDTPQCISADETLAMATRNGAKALGLPTGSIEVGKKADLALLDLDAPSLTPLHNPVAALAYSANGSEVTDVIIDGRPVLRNRELTTIDEERVRAEIARICHANGTLLFVDGAQGIPHLDTDVRQLGCDFYAFSGHKMYGPTGIGVLYGKEKYLEQMPPYQGGGDMIGTVTFEKTTYAALPYKFEAGTPDYIATHGLAIAIDYMLNIGMDKIEAHERELTRYALEQMQTIEGMRIFGPLDATKRDAVISFLVGDIHHLDMGTLLDRLGIAVRTGHHCAEPLMRRLGINGTVRASFGLYNTKEEIDVLVSGIKRVSTMF